MLIEKITKTSPGKLGKIKKAVLSPADTDKIRYIKDKLNLFSQRTIFDIYVSKCKPFNRYNYYYQIKWLKEQFSNTS